MTTWITDTNGNRASVEHWGSKENAQASLDTLKNCTDCTDCPDCYNCRNIKDLKYAICNVEVGEEDYKLKMKELGIK